jgi:hypothetical protein
MASRGRPGVNDARSRQGKARDHGLEPVPAHAPVPLAPSPEAVKPDAADFLKEPEPDKEANRLHSSLDDKRGSGHASCIIVIDHTWSWRRGAALLITAIRLLLSADAYAAQLCKQGQLRIA